MKKEPALAPLGSEESLDMQARSYLHVNCAHCHRFGGGGGQVVLELDIAKPLKETGILDVKPRQGDFGLPDARIVAPGDPYRSVLFYRMAKFGRGRMPHLGSEFPHGPGLDVIGKWIASLADKPKEWTVPQAEPQQARKRVQVVPRSVAVRPRLRVRQARQRGRRRSRDLRDRRPASVPCANCSTAISRRTRRAASSVATRGRRRSSRSSATRRRARRSSSTRK